MLLIKEDLAWVRFLLSSENSIIRDLGFTLALMTNLEARSELHSLPLAEKPSQEWEPALLLAECLRYSSNDELIELSRILDEWFAGTFET